MVRLDNVTKTYGRGPGAVRAVTNVSLEVAAGEFVSIVGASGSGKSTLLHLIGAIDEPDAGTVWIEGRALAGLGDHELSQLRRRRLGFVFQFFNLLPTLTVEENVVLPLLLDRRSVGPERAWVEELLTEVGLWARRSHKADELSGGEMQRVAIARALVAKPAILLADEPTGNLDTRTGREVLDLITGLSRRLEQTVLVVTHDPLAAARADRTIEMRDGSIVRQVSAVAAVGASAM